MTIKIPQTKYEVLPVGEYGALVESLEQVEGQYGKQIKIRFAIRAPADGSTRWITGSKPTVSSAMWTRRF